MIILCLDLTHSDDKSGYTCACVFKLPESFRSCYSFKRIHTLMLEVRAGMRKLGKTILFVQLEDWAGRPGLSTSHNVGARGTAVCFWFTLSF